MCQGLVYPFQEYTQFWGLWSCLLSDLLLILPSPYQQCRRAGCALRQPALSQCPQHPRCLVPTRAFSGWPQISRLRLTTCLPGAVSSSPERQGKAQALRGTAITSPSSFNCSRCALLFVLTAQVFPPYFLLNC